jgi:TonB family protein
MALEIPNQQARSELAIRAPTVGGVGPVVANRAEVEAMKGNSKRLNLQLGAVGAEPDGSEGRAGAEGAVNLIPSPAVLDSISGAAANDHLQDVDEGDGTFLNTREWKYASFFNRVKQSVGQQWNPNAQLRLRDPTLQVYGGRDRQTLLQVTLTADGHLKEAWVERSSGLDFLDLEAVKAFERAQPFPNPPSGLVAADQTVHFQFGFYLELSGRPGLRLFRAQD